MDGVLACAAARIPAGSGCRNHCRTWSDRPIRGDATTSLRCIGGATLNKDVGVSPHPMLVNLCPSQVLSPIAAPISARWHYLLRGKADHAWSPQLNPPDAIGPAEVHPRHTAPSPPAPAAALASLLQRSCAAPGGCGLRAG